MKIPYLDENLVERVGSYWSDGPVVKFYKDTRWVISSSGRPVLVGKKWRSTENEYHQIIDELQPGQELHVNSDGEAYVQ